MATQLLVLCQNANTSNQHANSILNDVNPRTLQSWRWMQRACAGHQVLAPCIAQQEQLCQHQPM